MQVISSIIMLHTQQLVAKARLWLGLLPALKSNWVDRGWYGVRLNPVCAAYKQRGQMTRAFGTFAVLTGPVVAQHQCLSLSQCGTPH